MGSTLALQNVNQADAIAHLAHAIWEKEGRPQGRDLEFWLQAEGYVKFSEEPQVNGVASALQPSPRPARTAPKARNGVALHVPAGAQRPKKPHPRSARA